MKTKNPAKRILKTAVIQMQSKPYALNENLQLALNLAKEAHDKGANLIVLPELFDSGYCVNENARERKRARLKRVGLLNQILAFYGLKINDWQGAKFVLCDKKGQSVIVNDLGDLWGKAQKLAKKEMDVLDSNLLAFLNQQTHATH
ncbi:hypothetical protein KVK01_01520 [Helicobacter pylori]|nr:hypothetical protein KVK01_01520 [Helicobacter pylori]